MPRMLHQKQYDWLWNVMEKKSETVQKFSRIWSTCSLTLYTTRIPCSGSFSEVQVDKEKKLNGGWIYTILKSASPSKVAYAGAGSAK